MKTNRLASVHVGLSQATFSGVLVMGGSTPGKPLEFGKCTTEPQAA